MTCEELISLLEVRYPKENVTLQSEGGRNIQIIGIDESLSAEYGCVVLTTAWSYQDKPVESEQDKLKRQRAAITKQIDKMKAEEKKAKRKAAPKKKKKRKPNATMEEQVAKGVIPTGQRGRPRKMVDDPVFIANLAEEHGLEGLKRQDVEPTIFDESGEEI